ncbi:MAG TPA: hypothetical protein PLA50_15580, partial [Bacteroidia bacterium]|nr:hypothetical protein [Bacteroidia bacterium]
MPAGLTPQAPQEADAPALAVATPTTQPEPESAPTNAAAPEAPSPDKADFLQRSHLILAKLLENDRAIDPFGMPMDPANAGASPYLSGRYAETE